MLPRRRMGSSHVIYTSGFVFLTLSFALIGIIALTLRFATGPQVLRVAVGPEDDVNAKLITAIARDLKHDGSGIRFVIIPVDDLKQSAQALAQGLCDLAVIRSDVSIPPNGETIVILHNDVALLTALPGSKITKVRDLINKRVGLFPATKPNAALLDAILSKYEIAPETVQHIILPADDLPAMMSQKRKDALFSVGPLRGSPLAESDAEFLI
jgi:TRAP-type uncharacterized transport system substrate-binding protein